MTTINVLLADDHTIVRQAINIMLSQSKHIKVIGMAENGRQALEIVKTHQPNVVLMDITMKSLGGLESTAQIVRKFPHVRVLILTMHTNEQYIRRSIKVGASGYLRKDMADTELVEAIGMVMQSKQFLCPSLPSKELETLVKQVKEENIQSKLDLLTVRQREVLQLIAEGETNQSIGKILSISSRTVDSHRTSLMNRLNIHDPVSLTHFAIQEGLVQPSVPESKKELE